MCSLADHEKELLLRIARRELELAARGSNHSPEADPIILDAGPGGGAFVTLRLHGRLRGCVGQIYSDRPLGEVVAYCARSAALEDSRFSPVSPEELADTRIEISALSRVQDIVPGEIVAGRHGLVVSRGGRSGVLLPQVATEFQWTAARLLEETCLKAGLEADAWKDVQTNIGAFTAEVFGEPDPWLLRSRLGRAV